MVNKYIKALLLTGILFAIGLLMMSAFDNARVNSISNQIELSVLESESTQQLLLYESVFDDSESVCKILPKRIDLQISKTSGLLKELNSAKAQGYFADTELPKLKYLNENILLYILVQKAIKDCENKEIIPLVYFYTENDYVADEATQAKVLDSVVQSCSNVRVFAFPKDMGIPVVDVLIQKYSISQYPAIILKNKLYSGITSENDLKQALGCNS